MPYSPAAKLDHITEREPWLDADYSPFRVPINAHRRFGLTTSLYFLRTPSRPTWLKIGIATDLAARLKGFQLANPDIGLAAFRTVPRPLDRQVEKLIHIALDDQAQGREWFEVSLAEALKVATPLIAKATRAVARMTRDGLFGYD